MLLPISKSYSLLSVADLRLLVTISSPKRTPVLVGVAGLEPAASWSRTKHATICATPRNSHVKT